MIGQVGKVPEVDTLTFAEAMALDPSEVEARDDFPYNDPQWFASTAWLYWTAANLRRCTFRRSRPKTRVDEMAEAFAGGHAADGPTRAMTEAIRSVCKWLRELQKREDADDELMPSDHAEAADQAERHFLEKR